MAPKVSGDFIPRDIIAKKGQPFKIAIPYNGNPIPTVAWTLVRFYICINHMLQLLQPGCIAQSVTCLATDACLTADPGVASSIPVRSHTFVEIDHEMISMVILLPSADSFKKGCCQLQAKVCARITG